MSAGAREEMKGGEKSGAQLMTRRGGRGQWGKRGRRGRRGRRGAEKPSEWTESADGSQGVWMIADEAL